MKRSLLYPEDRARAIAAVALVHAGIALALMNAQGRDMWEPEDTIEAFDVFELPPPIPPPPPEAVDDFPLEIPPPPTVELPAKQPEQEEGAAAPPNIKSQAAPVEAPKPVIKLPVPTPIATSPTPGQGTEPTQGAAPVPGPGTGAGGVGSGTGSGRGGSGPGGGGSGGGEPRGPAVVESTKLTSRDYPRGVIRAWPRQGRVFVAVRVQLDGRATDCKINRSSGEPSIDQWTCRLVEERVRFRPAVNERGQPFVAWYGYVQAAVNF